MKGWAGAALLVVLTLPPLPGVLEASMAGHMLVQLPLLALSGCGVALALPDRWKATLEAFNSNGLPGILLALFTAAFWMLPRSLDAALTEPVTETAKFVSLSLLVGAPLALSWSLLHPVTKSFVLANVLSMLCVLGWLYRQSPARLCNYYLLDQQVVAGNGLLAIAGFVLLGCIARAFAGAGFPRHG